MNKKAADSPEGSPQSASKRPKVTVSFSDYQPPFDVTPIVQRMLDSVPPKYLIGLSEVVLTNASGLPRRLRRGVTKSRKKKVKIVEARGLYHQEWQGKPAWIEISVDNALKGWEKGFWLKVPFIRENQLAEVLFHEIGHHIHYTARPEYREKEDVADVWKVRLERSYYSRRFPAMTLCVRLLRLIFGPIFERQRRKRMKRNLDKGWISRAEYEESIGRKEID